MKVFLTHAYYLNEDPKELEIMRPYVPLGILYISSYLKLRGIEVKVYDTTFKSFENQKEALKKFRPDIIAVYCNLMTKLNVLRLIDFIKNEKSLNGTSIILGGPEPANYAEEFLNYGADIIVKGEGEETMYDVCRMISEGWSPEEVPGLIFISENGKLIKTGERQTIKNLDDLPMPDRKSVELNLYLEAWRKAHGYSSVSLNTMRGCPYTCRWCSHSVYGVSYRRRSPEKVCDELEYLIETYNPDGFWFVDDVFTISHKWLFRFAEAMKQRRLKIKYECISRSDRLNEMVIKTLKDTGCFRLWIGAESGSQKVLDLMDRRVSASDTREKIKLAGKYGIETGTFIMLGYPGETKEDIYETARHLIEADPDFFLTTVAYPIKGTPFYSEVESRILTDKSWNKRTDRDLDFKGRYSKRFYRFANRYLINEVNYHKMKARKTSLSELSKTFLKAKISKTIMKVIS
ncbi:MAG: B12-binding domain-containing radical SAM protein [Ignavibacteria bacterium]|nr:B12-binding domain-containing radical SAM protein [Ignavibacteria bacterium]